MKKKRVKQKIALAATLRALSFFFVGGEWEFQRSELASLSELVITSIRAAVDMEVIQTGTLPLLDGCV